MAFTLIYTDGLTYQEAAETMQISGAAVAHLIKGIRRKYPDCVPKGVRHKVIRYDPSMDDQIKEAF